MTQQSQKGAPSWEFIWAKGHGKDGGMDGALQLPAYPPQPQPHAEPFLRRKRKMGSVYKKAKESRCE